MSKSKKFIFIFLILLCIACPIFTGCTFSCNSFSCTKGSDYELVIYPDSKAFSWGAVQNATGYEIYLNDKLVDTVAETECLYEFSTLLDYEGDYEFKVKALTAGMTFTTLQVVQSGTYTNTEKVTTLNKMKTLKVSEYSTTVELSDSILAFGKIAGVDDYAIAIYSNSTGYNEYDITPNYSATYNKYTLHLSPTVFGLKDEISAIRIMAVVDGVKYVASDIIYYNPDNYSGYTDNIYIFDGKIYDHYINTLDELQNIIYYSFIYRIEDFDIKISDEIYKMASIFDGGDFEECLDLLIYQYGFGSFSETIAYMAGNIVGQDRYFSTAISSKNRTYNIKVTYMGVYECDLDMEVSSQISVNQEQSVGYYETAGYTTLSEEYGDSYIFASDNKFLSVEVETTDELYWAVENGIAPVFTTTECRGYRIYNRAKEVLGEIISDDMSDFEKVLSIFDWICINTVYDYSAYENTDTMPTKFPCYYLEGVFDKGLAVCDGFSKAFSLMCNMLDIESIRVVGTAISGGEMGGHAWNKVLLDKDTTDALPAQYYIVDITWTEIYSTVENEILSHKYFLISDEMIEDTHTDFEYREEFLYLDAPQMYGYYEYMTFTHNEETYDYVLDSDEDVVAIFDYMLLNSIQTIEIIFDLDYLIEKYETNNNTTYNPAEDVSLTVVGNVYYNALRSDIIPFLKESKFAEQYIFMAYSLDAIPYDNDGSLGLVYSLTQNFLIDASGEVEELVSKLDAENIYGTFNLYVDNNMFSGIFTSNYLEKVERIFADALADAGIEITFELVQANYVYDETNNSVACHYTMTITEKSASA